MQNRLCQPSVIRLGPVSAIMPPCVDRAPDVLPCCNYPNRAQDLRQRRCSTVHTSPRPGTLFVAGSCDVRSSLSFMTSTGWYKCSTTSCGFFGLPCPPPLPGWKSLASVKSRPSSAHLPTPGSRPGQAQSLAPHSENSRKALEMQGPQAV